MIKFLILASLTHVTAELWGFMPNKCIPFNVTRLFSILNTGKYLSCDAM